MNRSIGENLPDQKTLETTQHVNHPAQYRVISNSTRGRYVSVKNTASGQIVTLDRTRPGDKQALRDILEWKKRRQAADPRKRSSSRAPEPSASPRDDDAPSQA